MEKLNKQMDDALSTKVTALNATDDETGDGKVDALDLKQKNYLKKRTKYWDSALRI